ncbi:MAG: hypothetical protein AAFQ36_00765 [Pseudomonadota bacterium]
MRIGCMLSLILCAGAAQADISVKFEESFPVDRFVFRNVGSCSTGAVALSIELATANGKLLFDTEGTGPGVERFAGFAAIENAARVVGRPFVADGSTKAAVVLSDLAPGDVFSFSIDIDDQEVNGALGQTQISRSELQGAEVMLFRADGSEAVSAFGETPDALLVYDFCAHLRSG